MILYNTTFGVEPKLADEFKAFVKDIYIPLAEESDMHGIIFSEVRVPKDQGIDTRNFAIQIQADSDKSLDDFRNDVLPHVYHLIAKQWSDGVLWFETVLDILV